MSGSPICQPAANFGGGGRSFGLPSGAPPSTQATMASTSFCERRRSLDHWPCAGSACHGGISRRATFSRMDLAHGRTSLKLISDIGAISPGRWQLMQFLTRIGAMSLLNVGAAASAPVKSPRVMTTAAAARQINETKTTKRERFIEHLLEIRAERNC